MSLTRTLDLAQILGSKHSCFLFGARGVGKTTLALETLKNWPRDQIIFIDLLHQKTFQNYLKDPSRLSDEVRLSLKEKKKIFVLLDEVQKVPALLDEVHSLIESEKEKIQFLLTGSSARKLKREGANMLGGRAWSFSLHPLTHEELDWNIDEALRIGTLPRVILDPKNAHRTLRVYTETYIKEEVQQEAIVRNLAAFSRFLEVAAQMNGEPLNFSKIGREAGVSHATIKTYYSILEDTYLGFMLHPWEPSIRKQIQQSSKFYFFDCGVLNQLREELSEGIQKHSYRYGKLFETLVIQEFQRISHYKEKALQFFYWRTNSNLEVDLIVRGSKKKSPIAIEIKSGSDVESRSLNGLKSFQKENPQSQLMVLCQSPRAFDRDGVPCYPWKEGLRKVLDSL